MSPQLSIFEAATVLNAGGVIAYPTEGVWGLGCDPFNEAAVQRLLEIKQRPVEKGMILIAASLAQLADVLDLEALPAERLRAVQASWPGPNTWVMPARPRAPRWITGAHDSIAVRVTDHATVRTLCTIFGGPLVSTSANLTGEPAVRHRAELDPHLLQRIDGVCEGQTGGLEKPTSIRDAISGEQLRA